MNARKISFTNTEGQALSAVLELPLDEEPIASALFAHCFTCSKDLRAARTISRALAARGFGVLRFDFTGLGESEGDFAETHFSSNAQDIVAASRFMESVFEAPSVLVGHSLGGAAVLLSAPQIPSVKAVATIGAPCSPEHVTHLLSDSIETIRRKGEADVVLVGRKFTIRKSFLDDLRDQNMQDVIASLKRALLVLHSPVDEIVSIENAARIFHHARHPKSFISLDEADHLLLNRADAEYAAAVIAAWSSRYMEAAQNEVKHPAPQDNVITARLGPSGLRTEILVNGHSLVADEPVAVGGTNAGPTPYNLVAAGLGACTAMTLRLYADPKKWPLESVSVELLHQKIHAEDCAHFEEENARIDHIQRKLILYGPLDESQRQRLVDIAEKYRVHRTMERKVHIETFSARKKNEDETITDTNI